MTPNANAAVWPRSSEPARAARRWRPPGRALALGVLLLVGAQYVGGAVFLALARLDVRQATPVTLVRYAVHYGAREDVRHKLVIASATGLGVVGVALLAFVWPRPRPLHGDARFATRAEIRAAGLLGARGIILGCVGRRCLMLDGQQGVALAAPPRAGKGTGVVIPNLLNWPDSLICVDIKRENWALTAGYRAAHGQACHLFDPFAEDGRTARWNPFHYVSADPERRVNDLQRIAEMLYPDPQSGDPFWTASARSLFLGIALYLFETPSRPKTIGEVLRQGMASDDEGFGQHWKRIVEGRMSGSMPLSSQCVQALYDVIDLAPVTASSIRKTFTSRLDLWLNPILDAATSGNDFDLRELRRTPTSIYVGVNPDDLHRLRPVLSLFFQQAIGLQTRALPEHDPTLKRQVLMMLDEFTALGRIPIVAEAISYLPGYNVRVVLVIQTPAQLREVYGANAAETMLKSLGARIAFAPKDFADAREISDELGNTTVKVSSVSKPAFTLGAKDSRGRSVTVSEQRRPLLLPQEVKALGGEEALVFYEGLPPIRCRKLRYYADRRFRARLLPPPERPAPAPRVVVPAREAAPASSPTPASVDTVSREATVEDLERLDELTLDDFDGAFDAVVLPEKAEGERMTSAELQAAADAFLESLRTR